MAIPTAEFKRVKDSMEVVWNISMRFSQGYEGYTEWNGDIGWNQLNSHEAEKIIAL